MPDYRQPSNNRNVRRPESAREEKKIETVVSGVAKTRKKSEVSKFANIFISEDVSNVKSYILMDVLVPTFKKAILGAIDMMLNGGKGSGYSDRQSAPKVSYRSYYDDPRDDRRYSDAPKVRARFDYDDIIYENRGDAEAVLDQMYDVVDHYGIVTVADMYDMARLPQPYTSNKYGWTRLRNVEVVRLRDGRYMLKLPKALPID